MKLKCECVRARRNYLLFSIFFGWLFYSPIHYIHLHARSHWTMALMSSFSAHTRTRFGIGFVSPFARIEWQWWTEKNNNNNNHRKHSSNHAATSSARGGMLALIGIAYSYTRSLILSHAQWDACVVHAFLSKTMKIIHNINFSFFFCVRLTGSTSFTFAFPSRIFISSRSNGRYFLFLLLFFVIYIDFSTFVRFDLYR